MFKIMISINELTNLFSLNFSSSDNTRIYLILIRTNPNNNILKNSTKNKIIQQTKKIQYFYNFTMYFSEKSAWNGLFILIVARHGIDLGQIVARLDRKWVRKIVEQITRDDRALRNGLNKILNTGGRLFCHLYGLAGSFFQFSERINPPPKTL